MNYKLLYFIVPLLLFSNSIFGFTINVVPTDANCVGNGTLTFNPSNTDPNGSIQYFIYKLPDTTVPVYSVTTTSINGLSAGDYRVIAKETVNGVVTTQTQDATINSTVVDLAYNVQSLNQACSTTSNVTINVTAGVAVSYEIIAGPMTFPSQSSNIFSGLPIGTYTFLVTDSCGGGKALTYTVTLNPTGLTIAPPLFTDTSPPNCAFIVANNLISSANGTVIGYPLSVEYTVHPPVGTAIIYNNTIVNGNSQSQNLSQTIPNYINQTYNYDIKITDACGTIVTNNFTVNQIITLSPTIFYLNCNNHYFELSATNFTPPYTLTFTTFPSGFNPADYPTTYSQAINDFGSNTSSIPIGNYEVTILDSCGRTTTAPLQFSVVNIPIIPTGTATNDGCLTTTGTIVIAVIASDFTSVIITNGPATYPFPYPHDISSLINSDGNITLSNVPIGTYTFALVDICATPLAPLDVTIPVYTNQGGKFELKNGCDLQKASLRISSNNGKLTSIILTAAPSSFSTPLNLTSNIVPSNGACYLNNLPPGNYSFDLIDECNFQNTVSVSVSGYTVTTNQFSLQPNCGSFDLPLNFVSNASNETFWLQKQINATTDTWGNPADSTQIYTNGTVPTSTNSIALTNNTTHFNLPYNGTFRIVHSFTAFNNGNDYNSGIVSSVDSDCIEILSPLLNYNQVLEIVDAYRLPCSANGNLDVVIIANGQNPIHYSIIEKDGVPFFLDNGNSNTFYNLPPGNYIFKVDVACGDFKTRPFNLADLVSLVTINPIPDLLSCQLIISGNETFDLTSQNATILGSQSASQYTISYYNSQSNAQSGNNPILNSTNYNPITNPETIYLRMVYNALPNCYETRTFQLFTGQIPSLNINPDYLNCSTSPTVIDASTGNPASTTYLWSDGSTNPVKSITQIGTTNLTVTATNSYGVGMLPCTSSPFDVTVVLSEIPKIDHIETVDWTTNENSITVITSNTGAFEYSLDGIHYQNSNYFSNLIPGLYTVFIRDLAGCGIVQQTVWLLNYPKYFTPNGDGFHETWRIENQELETNFTVYIYDRYGKLINYFPSNSIGWDGTYNGNLMLATDYWFVVNRQDGRRLTGHFSLKR
ncbi:T9SS type B sorting domain-containing protein [Flavobacterium sp. SUN052]|uniref:T9SS type B sorting domain-containing protein n=1 Tax=Flavobacterium sp. SUN052 TaxID=3002441 RepID=UPI00237DF423|nr:T9SS type B sorting domain-containing protein [Flavobacterium sp. SUN052]MEC4005195.1 T9SS type B sorting domain-containing protein [Flavobacterium sp. SUN052]